MLKVVIEVDENGYFIDSHVAEVDENGNILDDEKKYFISKDFPNPNFLFKPKWNGIDWVEGEMETERLEREAVQQLESLLPSQNEIADAELEIKVITLLNELGVIV